MATPGRHSANFLATPCVVATCAGSARSGCASPATPAAPAGSLSRRDSGAQAATAGKETGYSGFLPSVALAESVARIRSPDAHLPATGLYGCAAHLPRP